MLKRLLCMFVLCGVCVNLSLAKNASNFTTNLSAKAENNASCQKNQINKFFDAKAKTQNKQSVKIPTH